MHCRSMRAAGTIYLHDEFEYAEANAYFCQGPMWDLNSQRLHFGESSDLVGSETTAKLIDNDTGEVVISAFGRVIGQPRSVSNSLLPFRVVDDEQHNLLAAYATATWPGEKTQVAKDILVGQISPTNTYGYRAADGLGKMGKIAGDAIPSLLRYAAKTASQNNSSSEHAIEAASRLDPTLRSQYPEIDQKLKLEEQAFSSSNKPVGFAQSLTALAKLGDDSLRKSISHLIERHPDGEQMKTVMIARLKKELANADDGQKVALAKAIRMVQETTAANEPLESNPLPLSNLFLDSRVLLVDKPNRKIQAALEDFERQHPPEIRTAVTKEHFRALIEKLRSVYSEFASDWTASILKNYPDLDRMIVGDQP